MPFQYVTFDDGQPLSARQIQKISSNQFELSETYNERSRGLVYNKVIPKELGSISVTAAGDAVKLIQHALTLVEDGDYGPATKKAVIAFQDNHDILDSNGIVGPKTWEALMKTAL